MTNSGNSATSLQLRSLVKASGELELALVPVPIPVPEDDEVLVRVEASPINPSDLGLLFGPADLSTARQRHAASSPSSRPRFPEAGCAASHARVGQSMPVGNEGAGVVVGRGASAAAQALLGRTVGLRRRDLLAVSRVAADECLPFRTARRRPTPPPGSSTR